jgi:DNA-binding HxlR family transcriptional regulator
LVLFLYRIYFYALLASGMIGDDELQRLTGGRWLMPLMAQLAAEDGSRFAAMLARLGLSRSALAASLAQLREAGWVRRNPGHGHPLRPEYVLTGAGAPIAAFAARIMAQRQRLGLEPAQLPRWSLPVVGRLSRDRARFSALRAALPPVTPRALSLTLKQMLAAALIDRALRDEFPPIAIYGLTGRGESLAEAMR